MPKTSELPAKLAPTGTEEIPVNDGGTSRKIAASALLDRARHIGTQIAATISDFAAAVDARITAAGLATQAALNAHTGNTANPHAVTKAQVGLGAVPNIDATLRGNHTGTQSADTLTDGVTNVAMLATERAKLTGVATGATANATDAQLRDRTTHTGLQLAATISNFDAQVRVSRLDQLAVPTAPVALNAQRLTGVADPTAAQDAATRAWVLATLAYIGCKITNSVVQALADATNVITFNTETWVTGVTHSTVTNPSRITIVTPGKYEFSALVQIQPIAGLSRITSSIRKNGTNPIAVFEGTPGASSFVTCGTLGQDQCIAGDYYEVTVTPVGAAPTTYQSAASPIFTCQKIG